MKKLFLLLLAGSFAYAASAQYQKYNMIYVAGQNIPANSSVRGTPAPNPALKESLNRKLHPERYASKTTTNGGNNNGWISHYHAADTLHGNYMDNNSHVVPIFFDSTVLERFQTGLGTINWSGVADIIDPSHFDVFTTIGIWNDPSMMWVSPTDAYTVDSIDIVAAYVENANRPAGVIDTLLVSIEVNTNMVAHTASQTNFSWVGNYLPTNQTTMYIPEVKFTDANNVNPGNYANHDAAFSSLDGTTQILFRIPLDATVRSLPQGNNTFTTMEFAFPVGGFDNPTSLSVPAGNAFVCTYTFKSGDTWTPNQDSFDNINSFWPVMGEAQSPLMPYDYYNYNDQNMSQMLFSFDRSAWYPTITIEGLNPANAPIDAFLESFYHITCATCLTVNDNSAVGKVTKNALTSNAFPNPATTDLSIPFTASTATDLTITLTNTLGQVVMGQTVSNMASGTAHFDVSGLSAGVYFYSVQTAKGDRSSGRVVVSH